MTSNLLPSTSSLIGQVLLGRYRVVRELAKGGMGVVYLARSEGAVGFVKPVVIKLVLPEHAEDRRFLGMFAREAQILAHLRHPSIATVLEFGEQDGAYVMVLEYVRGYHLGQWTRYLRLKGRQVPADVALQLTLDVLDALHHAHAMVHPDGSSMQIVHRDVSPSNILLDEDGRARLLDFGVARMRGHDVNYQTQVKGFVGKLMYSAPEVFTDGESTPRSDSYACAVVLHEMLLGKNGFRGENQARTLHNVLSMMPEALESQRADVPRGLDAVLQKALAKSPSDRYASAREFAAALRALAPDPESEVRARLSTLVKADFNREMADMLGIESLTERDTAWRRLNSLPSTSEELEIAPEDVVMEQTSVPDASETHARRDETVARRPPRGGSEQNSLPPTSTGRFAASRSAKLPLVSDERVPGPPALPVAVAAVEAPSSSKLNRLVPHLVWASVALAAVAVAGYVMTLPRDPGSQAHAAPTSIQVVQTARPAIEQLPEPGSEAETAVPELVRTAAEPAPPPAAAPANAPATRVLRPSKTGPNAEQLTRAFRKQQGSIAGCFEQYAAGLSGMPVITLDFSLLADGTLAAVKLQPSALAASPLGQCIQRVAAKTNFPAQGQAISFAIPVSASKGPQP